MAKITGTPFKIKDIKESTRINMKIDKLIETAEQNKIRIKSAEIKSLKLRGLPKSPRPGAIE